MKKKFIIAALGVSAVLAAAAVHAQTASSTANADRAADSALFNMHKKKQLDSINEHLAKMHKRQACIQAAENEKALSACSSVIREAIQPANAVKIAPAAVMTAPASPAPAASAPAAATLPRSIPATLPATTPATPVKP